MAEEKQEELNVNTNTLVGSVYAQIVGVIVTDFDITLEFVYKNPRPDIKEAQVVARVTLPRDAGEKLPQAITEIMNNHKKKKGGRNA